MYVLWGTWQRQLSHQIFEISTFDQLRAPKVYYKHPFPYMDIGVTIFGILTLQYLIAHIPHPTCVKYCMLYSTQFSKTLTLIIMVGPQWWWDLYFFMAYSACFAFKPFLCESQIKECEQIRYNYTCRHPCISSIYGRNHGLS